MLTSIHRSPRAPFASGHVCTWIQRGAVRASAAARSSDRRLCLSSQVTVKKLMYRSGGRSTLGGDAQGHGNHGGQMGC